MTCVVISRDTYENVFTAAEAPIKFFVIIELQETEKFCLFMSLIHSSIDLTGDSMGQQLSVISIFNGNIGHLWAKVWTNWTTADRKLIPGEHHTQETLLKLHDSHTDILINFRSWPSSMHCEYDSKDVMLLGNCHEIKIAKRPFVSAFVDMHRGIL